MLAVAAYFGSVNLVESQSIVSMTSLDELNLQTDATKTYFLQESVDLKNWYPLSTYVVGDGTLKQIQLPASSNSKNFYRFGIVPTNNSDPDDSDGDGIKNSYELSIGLDPTWINSVTDLAIREVDSRIIGKTATDSLRIFDNYAANGPSLIFNRNPNCWISNLENISCISPWNNQASNRRAGTLITPRHVIFCAHGSFFVPANRKIYFVDDLGTVVERTVLATKRHPDYSVPSIYNNDIVIGVLNQDVPSSIKCVKFFPDDWGDYLFSDIRTPSLRLNQHEEALVGDFYVGSIGQERAYHLLPTESHRLDLYLSLAAPTQPGLYSGDSGNGGFLAIDSQLVLTNVWTYGGPGSGTSVTNEKAIINTMISQLDTEVGDITGHVIEEIDLSKFMKLSDIPLEFLPISTGSPPAINEADYPFLEE